MDQDIKAEIFNKLATSIDSFAWVSANLLKAKFGIVDDEEEYKKIQEQVVDYAQSQEFKDTVQQHELDILAGISETALNAMQELTNGNN